MSFLHYFRDQESTLRTDLQPINKNTFPTISKNEWIELAAKQLKSDDPIDALKWNSDTTILAYPYYDETDLEGLSDQIDFFKRSESHHWKLYDQLNVKDDKTANQHILDSLEGGCDGVVLTLHNIPDFEILLKDVYTEICDISIISDKPLKGLSSDLHGFLLTPEQANVVKVPHFDTQVESLAWIISNLDSHHHLARESCTDFFLEISVLRSLRYLMHKHFAGNPWDLQIHTSVPSHPQNEYQFFANTTSGLASILGGSNSISFHPDSSGLRISRNIGNLIREEANISAYADQLGGSFYVEHLTGQLVSHCEKLLKERNE